MVSGRRAWCILSFLDVLDIAWIMLTCASKVISMRFRHRGIPRQVKYSCDNSINRIRMPGMRGVIRATYCGPGLPHVRFEQLAPRAVIMSCPPRIPIAAVQLFASIPIAAVPLFSSMLYTLAHSEQSYGVGGPQSACLVRLERNAKF